MDGSTEHLGALETTRLSVPRTSFSFLKKRTVLAIHYKTYKTPPPSHHSLVVSHLTLPHPNAAAAQPQESALSDMRPDAEAGSGYNQRVDLDLYHFQSNPFGTNGQSLLVLTTLNNKYS